ncbi:hypothetical protein SAMN04489764_1379 [Thermostaphylospora chromogena]|uniref:Uncharacterized protein n=1 Tax=Thermostaphylospora chromogena TaxID=35622 RepID=A0A1H1CAG7_9ACTN|nr:hypothetical protein SAMN04489764_1379 [Thermostaphylospora chromogena]
MSDMSGRLCRPLYRNPLRRRADLPTCMRMVLERA